MRQSNDLQEKHDCFVTKDVPRNDIPFLRHEGRSY